MLDIEKLEADIKLGTIKYVTRYGASILQKPLPCVIIVQGNGSQGDTIEYQLWVCMAVGQDKELQNYLFDTLPRLLSERQNDYGQKYWKWRNAFNSATIIQEGSQTFLRAGLVVMSAKEIKNYSPSQG